MPGGRISVGDAVVAKLANLAAREVDEVVSLGGAVAGAISGVVARVRGDEHRTAGVDVEISERRVALALSVALRYPVSLEEVTERVRQGVIERVETLTGLEVTEVNVEVIDLVLDSGPADERPRVA